MHDDGLQLQPMIRAALVAMSIMVGVTKAEAGRLPGSLTAEQRSAINAEVKDVFAAVTVRQRAWRSAYPKLPFLQMLSTKTGDADGRSTYKHTRETKPADRTTGLVREGLVMIANLHAVYEVHTHGLPDRTQAWTVRATVGDGAQRWTRTYGEGFASPLSDGRLKWARSPVETAD